MIINSDVPFTEEELVEVEKEITKDDKDDDDEIYRISPWGCLLITLRDYGVDVSHISGKVGGHIVEDFMDLMIKARYVAENKDYDHLKDIYI